MVKMTSYDENIKKSKNFEKSIFSFFVPMALGKPPGRPGAGTEEKNIFFMKKNMKTKVVGNDMLIMTRHVSGPET